jgi:hypothetical protein
LYESANLIRFEPGDAAMLLGRDVADQADALAALQRLFASWWEVKQAAEARGIPFSSEVDFLP